MKSPPTLSYHLMGQIRDLIVNGTYKPGQRLGEQELELRFDSSRSPIREALRLLEITGLVVHLPRRGFRVRRMSSEEIRDLYHLRSELEAYSIRLLSGRPNLTALINDLNKINDQMTHAFETKNVADYLQFNGEFHASILEFSQNKPLAFALDKINQIAQPLRHNALVREMSSSSSLRYHRQITEALKKCRFDEAEVLMREHVLVSLPSVQSSYQHLLKEVDASEEVSVVR